MQAGAWGLLALGYLCGSIPFGLLLTRWWVKKDVRSLGSGNIGATNVTRVAGKKVGLLVLLLDALKGAGPVWVALTLYPSSPELHAGVALAAFLGHVFSVWLKFRGGKGVATALGVLGVLLPEAALAGVVVYVVAFLLLRLSSVGSLLGGLTAVGVSVGLDKPMAYRVLVACLLVMMIWTHRSNLQRLRQRAEKRV